MCVLQSLVAGVSSSLRSQRPNNMHIPDSEKQCDLDGFNLVPHDTNEYDMCGVIDIIEVHYGGDVRHVETRSRRNSCDYRKLTFSVTDQTPLHHRRPLTPSILSFDVLCSHPQPWQLRPECRVRRGSIEHHRLASSNVHVVSSIHEHETTSEYSPAAQDCHELPRSGGASKSRETELYDAAPFCFWFYPSSQHQECCFNTINGTAGLNVKARSFNQHHDGKIEPQRRTCARQSFKAKSSDFNRGELPLCSRSYFFTSIKRAHGHRRLQTAAER